MNAISKLSNQNKIILGLIIIFILWSLLGNDESVSVDRNLSTQVNTESDYGMSNFKMTIMDEDGLPSRIIKGSEMSHFPKGDTIKIIMPEVEFIDQGKETWIISSLVGETLPHKKKRKKRRKDKGDKILLTGNVIITQKNNSAFKLSTDKLTINTKNDTAYTNSPVKIASPYGATNSVGLHATLKDKTINLHSKVKGQYDAPLTQ